MRRQLAGLGLILMLALSGCAGGLFATAEPLPTETPTATTEPTATIQWFPNTATPTPLPPLELQPTPAMRPGVGALLLEDDFSSEADWATQKNAAGSVGLGRSFIPACFGNDRQRTLSALRRLFATL